MDTTSLGTTNLNVRTSTDADALPQSGFPDQTNHSPVRVSLPHPVRLVVGPRDVVVGQSGCSPVWWEAFFDVEIDHPAECSGFPEECPVADYLDLFGIERDFLAPWGAPDSLTDAELDALDGDVKHLVITSTTQRYSGPDGIDYDVEFDFAWFTEPAEEALGAASS